MNLQQKNVLGLLALAVVLFLVMQAQRSAWAVGEVVGPGATISRVQKTLFGYRYWLSYEEVPGLEDGPFTEAQIRNFFGI